jgi:hypothetical protein
MSLISAITSKGHMRFMIKDKGGVNAEIFIEFLKRLISGATNPIFLIIDRGPAHIAKKTRSYVESLGGKLQLFVCWACLPRRGTVSHCSGPISPATGKPRNQPRCTRRWVWTAATVARSVFRASCGFIASRLLFCHEILAPKAPHGAAAFEPVVIGVLLLRGRQGRNIVPKPDQLAKAAQRGGFVAMLRVLAPCYHGKPGRYVHSPHGALGLVLVLAAWAARAECLETHIGSLKRNQRSLDWWKLKHADKPVLALAVRPHRTSRYPQH